MTFSFQQRLRATIAMTSMASATPMTRMTAIGLALSFALAGCGGTSLPVDANVPGNDAATDVATPTDVPVSSGDASDDAATDTAPVGDAGLVTARPYRSRVPVGLDRTQPLPLVILLHGYSANGQGQDLYFGLSGLVDTRHFLYAYPDGTQDSSGRRFWNATDACCDLEHRGIDDVAYVTAIIDDMSARYNVDPQRVFLIGHSNGGFMSHRMACDVAPRIAGIVSLAGMNWLDMTRCAAANPVAVLQVHGDADATIAYNGGIAGAAFPSARATVMGWATRNHCGDLGDTTETRDIDSVLAGNETTVSRATGCAPGGAAELWTIHGGGHIPSLQPTWGGMILDWLFAHPRPTT